MSIFSKLFKKAKLPGGLNSVEDLMGRLPEVFRALQLAKAAFENPTDTTARRKALDALKELGF